MKTRLSHYAALAFALSCGDDKTRPEIATSGTLTLVRERKFAELLEPGDHYEASGVALDDGALRVVFDNSSHVAAVDLALSSATLGPGGKSPSQYEGITIATRPVARTYVVKEMGAGGRGTIVTLDELGDSVATEASDIAFGSQQKGLEGIAWLDDIERLLVLCEANSCGAGDESADRE